MSMGAWADDELPPCEGDQMTWTACSYTWASGEKYVGEWKDGKRNGYGTYTFADGNKYVGEYKEGGRHGQGTYTYANGDKYVGEWKDGKRYKEKWVDTRTEAECTNGGPDTWDAEKQKCVLAGAPFAFEVFPKLIKNEDASTSFIQSVILFLPKQEGEERENVLMVVERNGVQCRHHGRVTFLVTLNKDKKITKIEGSEFFCAPKEDFNACIAEPFGWDLSLVEDDEVCFHG